MRDLLKQVARLRVLVVGDVMLDHYIWGDASRISPEAPVPVVTVERDVYGAGAAANVALNCVDLGAEATLAGPIGADAAGTRLQALLVERGAQLAPFCVREGTPTVVKTRVVVRGQQLCRLDREAAPPVYSLDAANCLDALSEWVSECDTVIVSDYAKGAVSEKLLDHLVRESRSENTFLAVDPKPSRPLAFRGVDLLTPNRAEALQLAGISIGRHEDFPAEAVCAAIWQTYAPRNLVITLGSEGMLLSREGRCLERIPTFAREVFDVSGAGDTSVAALALGLTAGASLPEAARFANTAAGVVVGKLGAATVTPDELLSFGSNPVA
ncbi:MAG: bifunctional heptose 7-phosphate kinase/heptose 1-phosphate adenyltransferase [Opitutales bacterium]